MQIIYHGHSFVEIELEQGSILIDPFVTGNPKCDISLEDLFSKKITHILLTHGHGDHVGDTVELCNHAPEIRVLAMVELAHWLEHQGVTQTVGANIGGKCQMEGFSVKFVRADHSNSTPDGQYAGLAAGLLVFINDKVIYHAGDTAYYSDMELLASEHIDCAFLPIGDHYTMGIDDAVLTAQKIKATTVVPVHYNTWPVIKADDIEFARKIMLGQHAVPKVLRAGQYVIV